LTYGHWCADNEKSGEACPQDQLLQEGFSTMSYRIGSAARTVVESLEVRQLLASISGTVIEDLDNDGQRDGRERALAGVTVFLDQNRNRQLDAGEASTVTNSAGRYEFAGLPVGQYFVSHLPPAGYGQNSPGKGGFGNFSGKFNITLAFASGVTDELRSIVESAAARWEKVLVGDLTGVADERYGDIDDIVIEIFAKKVDGVGGTLASAGPRLVRDASIARGANLPYRSAATFDIADSKNPGLYDTAVHELGHALGFTLNTWFSFDDEEAGTSLIGGRQGSPLFLGANALREYRTIFNQPKAPGVPLEPFTAGAGSAFSHFSEALLGNEMMTPFAESSGSPLSRITVGLMQDIGYVVDYRAADPYDPTQQDLPVTNPDNAGGGLLDFSYTITIDDPNAVFQGRDFSSRQNQRPTLDAVRSENALYAVNDIVKLRAVGANDNDIGDAVTAVAFYLESNNIPGLQTGRDGDTPVNTDQSPAGGFRVNANTESLGLAAGTYTFYARPFDQILTAGKTKQVEVQIFDPTTAPRKPTELAASSISSSEVVLQWNDRSNNEFGFVIDRARDEFFTRDVKRFTLGGNTTTFTDTRLPAGTQFFYRVRSFNIGGPSSFAGPLTVRTGNLGERVIDVTEQVAFNRPEAKARGQVSGLFDPNALNSNSLVLFGGTKLDVSPFLEFDGDYFVYARWSTPSSELGMGVFDIKDSNGRQQRPVTIDLNTRGTENGYVLIGKYTFNTTADATVTFRPLNRAQTVNLDAVRFLPAFDPTTRGRA